MAGKALKNEEITMKMKVYRVVCSPTETGKHSLQAFVYRIRKKNCKFTLRNILYEN